MPLPVVCPACSHKFNVPDKYAGKRGKCPECANVFRAPTAEEAQAARAAQPSAVAEPPPVASDDLPVGLPLEVAPPPPAFEAEFFHPAPAFITEKPRANGAAREHARHVPPSQNLVILGTAAGAIGLILVVSAVVWAASNGYFRSSVAANKSAKKATANDIKRDTSTIETTPSPKGLPRAALPANPPIGKKPGEDLGPLPEFEKPERVVPSPSVPVPPARPEPRALSAETITRLHAECEKLGKPANAEEFARLQELARLVTLGKAAGEDAALPADEREAISAAAQAVLEKYANTPWPTEGDIGTLNRLAAEALKGDELGVFAYGTIRFSGESGGRTFLLVDLGGTMETLGVPVKTSAEDTPPGSRWLILGRRSPGNFLQVRSTNGDGEEKQFQAAVVLSVYIVGEPKGD